MAPFYKKISIVTKTPLLNSVSKGEKGITNKRQKTAFLNN
jgi:hypothetical protein